MARRSIWDDEEKGQETTANNVGWGAQPDVDQGADDEIQPERPATILDQLRTAEPKIQKVRDRSWERENPKKSYRKVPYEIRDNVNEIAETYGYNTSQIAQAFLEYALMCYRRGDFELELELGQNGLTLMPGGWSAEKKPIWAESTWGGKSPKKKKRRSKTGTPLWKQAVYYRLSPDLIAQIEEVCEAHRNPDGSLISRTYHDGEVVARFLTFSIEAYNTGNLTLSEPEDE
ncbi:MAG: hypothetical protein H8D34_27435 [Chloroflexi bacterium]|nr:hypothetical protein [Chloroflexota bacterium]